MSKKNQTKDYNKPLSPFEAAERKVVSSVTSITNELGDVSGAVGFVRDVKDH